jgi:hypothetical protein
MQLGSKLPRSPACQFNDASQSCRNPQNSEAFLMNPVPLSQAIVFVILSPLSIPRLSQVIAPLGS